MATKRSAILFEALAPVSFPRAWDWQRQLQQRLLEAPSGPEALIVLEHEPCYTLGRGASLDHLGFDVETPPLPLFRIDRGGEVTHHGPGQLVLYPILDLRRHGSDLHGYLRALEGVVIDLLGDYGLAAERCTGLTGVWLDGHKVAAIGVGAKRWISQHGLALNVDCDLAGFSRVVPCGLADRPVGRLLDWRPQLSAAAVAPRLLEVFADRFGLVLRAPGPQDQLQGW